MTTLPAYELVFDVDAETVAKTGCPCPIEHCTAYVLRTALCGDPKGDYFGGVHVGRLRRLKNGRWKTKMQRRMEKIEGETSPLSIAIAQAIEDGMNLGLVSGQTTEKKKQERLYAKIHETS